MTEADRRTVDRRSRIPAFRYPERRSGFDRRAPHDGSLRHRYRAALLWYRRTPVAVAAVLVMVLALNLADLLLTLNALDRGAVELNPVMAQLFDAGTAPAAVFKLVVGGLAVAAMWKMRHYRRILEVTVVVALGLTVLVTYEVATTVLSA